MSDATFTKPSDEPVEGDWANDWIQTLTRPKGIGAPAVLVLRLPDDWVEEGMMYNYMRQYGFAIDDMMIRNPKIYVAIKDKAEDILAVFDAD